MTSNVAVTSTTGLYGITSNVQVPNSASQLLNLLYSNGNVNFSLAPGNTKVQANAMVSSGGGGSTYGNANVAAYLASNTDPTISTLNANSAVQAVAINTVNANIGAYQTFANANASSQATSINTINANLGAFQTYANATFGTSSYGNTQATALLANFGTNAISTSGNITGGFFVGNAAALDRTTGAATGTYGSDTTIPTIVVDAKGRITQITTNAISGGGSYGNSNVAAYLASNTDATISNLNANAAVQAVAINSINANLGAYQTYGNVTFSTVANAASQQTQIDTNTTGIATVNANLGAYQTYGNVTFSTVANAASQQTQIDTLQTNAATQATSINTINANLGSFQTYANATFGTSSYGNANVAAYLPTYSGQIGGTVVIPNISTANAQITGGNVSVYNSTATNRFIGPHFDAADSAGGSLRNSGQTALIQWGAAGGTNIALNGATNINPANAQVSISPTGTGSVNIKPTGHLDINPPGVGFMNNVVIGNATPTSAIFTTVQTSGNITANAGAYFLGDGSKLTGISATSTYGNANVTAFLNGTAPTNYITGAGNSLVVAGGVATPGSGAILQMSATSIGGFPGPVAYFNNTNVAVASGNISTSFGPTMGTCLYDTVNERLFINAFPLSTPESNISNNIYSNFMVVNPVYTNNQVQQPPLANATTGGATIVSTSSQVVGLIQSSNIALQSGYGFGSQNRNTVGTLVGMTVNPVTANVMNNNDRVRAFTAAVEYQSNIAWGAMSTASQNASSINGISSITYLNNGSSIGSAVGALTGVIITPPAGLTSNVQYATGSMPFTNLLNTAGTTGKSNVVYSRAVAPFVTGFSSNLTVQYAVGLHTYSGWAGSGVVGAASNPVLGRFVVLNEDVNSTIQTNGNLVVTGNTSLNAIQETQAASGNISGTVSFSYATGTVKTATLTGNITVNTNNIVNMPVGGTITLILTQDGTGSRTLTSNIKFAGGSKTLSTAAGAIDTISIYNDGTNMLAALVKGYA